MKQRIERCCLLLKNPERIVEALYELKDLGFYVAKIEPVLSPLAGFTNKPLSLRFDLDHVFLINYKLSGGKVVKINGFHADYERQITKLGREEPNRVVVHSFSKNILGVVKVIAELDKCLSVPKTLFPYEWSWIGCLASALQALANILPQETKRGTDGLIRVRGLANEKIVIEFAIDVEKEQVITFYPNRELTKKYMKGKSSCYPYY